MNVVATDRVPSERWSDAWPDALAFAAGLGLAWALGWETTDLVWSLWLSSLAVGYVTILTGALAPAVLQFRDAAVGRGIAAAIGALPLIAFFTVHFGLFHAAHAAFLNQFFPLLPGHKQQGFVDLELLAEVVRRYGWFLPIVLVAERQALRLPAVPPEPPRMSVRAADVAARKARQLVGAAHMFRPYVNVVRLHLLIFFFAAVHAAALGGFLVYAVVYAAYFFPWRLVRLSREPRARAA
ncbi:MAG TPA: DUF6498-containing protein [Gammaproteobacteria bacterium]|nr:DUF6498-containing protein [Gammaproteobacteria bacterium]